MKRYRGLIVFAWLSFLLTTASRATQNITFEDRVRAQESIEQVAYAHQIGATAPFHLAVPRALLEAKVRRYLRLSSALEKFWNIRVTAPMLDGEMTRLAERTRMPDRLREIYRALGNDPLIIQECYARPILVERLARELFASDSVLQGRARAEAEALWSGLSSGTIDPAVPQVRRTMSVVRRADGRIDRAAHALTPAPTGEPAPFELDTHEYDRFRAELPVGTGRPGLLEERDDSFVVRVVLEETSDTATLATYTVPKRSWDAWWSSVSEGLDDRPVHPIAPEARALPVPPSLPCPSDDSWDPRTLNAIPHARDQHTAVWTGSVMVVWGGYGGSYLSSGSRYDPVSDTWLPTSLAGAPAGRERHTAIWTGNRMVVWGGTDGTLRQDGGRYDPVADVWYPMNTAGAAPGSTGHSATWTGSVMVVWGGYTNVRLAVGGRYDPVSDTWTNISTFNAPAARSQHTAVWTGSRVVIWGGFGDFGLLNTGGRYDPVHDTWESTSLEGAPVARAGHTAVWTGAVMVVWGGAGASLERTGGRYDPVADTWLPTSLVGAPIARLGHEAVWTGAVMVVWSGSTGSGYTVSGGRYDPVTDTWTPTATSGSPSARRQPTLVWTGSVMIAWGGRGGSDSTGVPLATGGRYDPLADTWLPTNIGTTPTGRYLHSSVWAGNVMIVWGGYNGAYERTGGRYDPVADAWTPTSALGAPAGRESHTAVWTGTQMIVWGGDHGFAGNENTGGRYDPATDSWSPTSTILAPGARTSHSAVWTGGRMIVWGGLESSPMSPQGSGGRYDPATDTWLPTSLIGAPSRRNEHTAVWTGSVMIVYGGVDDADIGVSGGARYNPASDSWAPVAGNGAPVVSEGHSAIWTGQEMLVWGVAIQTGSGGRYDPVSNTWRAIPVAGAPKSTWHRAVWTGREMVVWGGQSNLSQFSNAGGRYNPATDSWEPTAIAGAPIGRYWHTAEWTGDAMLVWGGYNGSYEATGGLYLPGMPTSGLDRDGDGFICASDCDDTRADVHPGAAEVCDGLDNDCDGIVDHFTTTCGLGQCAALGQCVAGADSCLPAAPSAEVCDGLDNDCNGVADQGLPCSAMRIDVSGPAVTWDPVAGATLYDLVWGSAILLRDSSGDYFQATQGCAASNTAGTTVDFTQAPGPGDAIWILARPKNGNGFGTYDDAPGGGPGQLEPRDGEIDASPGSCP